MIFAFKYSAGAAARSMPTYDDGSTPTLVTEKPPAIAVRTANTGANGSGVTDEPGHTVDTTGPEAIAYAVRMREGCRGGARAHWCRKTSAARWQLATTRRYSVAATLFAA